MNHIEIWNDKLISSSFRTHTWLLYTYSMLVQWKPRTHSILRHFHRWDKSCLRMLRDEVAFLLDWQIVSFIRIYLFLASRSNIPMLYSPIPLACFIYNIWYIDVERNKCSNHDHKFVQKSKWHTELSAFLIILRCWRTYDLFKLTHSEKHSVHIRYS